MQFWISPFKLLTDGLNLLAEAGLQPWELGKGLPPSGDCLLLYDCPDQILANSSRSHRSAIATPEQLMEGYTKVLDWSEQTRQPMLAVWRLQQLGPSGLGRWIESGGASLESEDLPQPHAPAIQPLMAAATLALMEACPQLLDSYLDIELKAELFGGDPDLHYRQRLREASLEGEILLQELHAIDVREEAELTLLQLHQVQEELEAIFLADGEKQRLIDTQTNEIETQVKQLEGLSAEVDGLRQQLELREGELNDAREEAELTLLQLHQVQEELEAIFLADREKQRLIDTQTNEIETQVKQLEGLSAEVDGLRQQLELREGELNDAREDAELTLLQLHQVQEELEAIFLADREKQRLIDTQTNEIETQAKELEGRSAEVHGLRQQLELREAELEEAREDAELTLLQLHQVQEELEHYFLRSKSGDALAHNQHLQLRRAQQLLARLHPPFANLGARPSITPVEVLPKAHSHPQATTLQTEALLSTYALSLSRAKALLQRSLNR